MTRKTTLIASTLLALSAGPLIAADHAVEYDPANTLAGETADVTTINMADGGSVWTNGGIELGKIVDFSIDNQNRATIRIDLGGEAKFTGDTLLLSVDPSDVTVMNGSLAVNASEQELFVLQENLKTPSGLIKVIL